MLYMITDMISKDDIKIDSNSSTIEKKEVSLKAIDDALASVDSIIDDIK